MINILISGAGGDICNGVIKSLIASKINLKIYVCGSDSQQLLLYYPFKTLKSPKVIYKNNYVNFIKKTVIRYKISFFFPTIDREIDLISLFKKKIKCFTLIDNYNSVRNFSDKLLAHNFFLKEKIRTPKTILYSKNRLKYFKLPFIIKKRKDSGSKNITFIKSNKDITKLILNEDFLIQEFIKGKDYTAGAYKINNRIKILIFERRLINGKTQFAKKIFSKKIYKELKVIFLKLNLNFCNIQFIVRKNKIFIYEINPRLSGSIGLQSIFFNFISFIIKKNITKQKLKNKKKSMVSAIRINDFLFI
jgi:hypothetical protein